MIWSHLNAAQKFAVLFLSVSTTDVGDSVQLIFFQTYVINLVNGLLLGPSNSLGNCEHTIPNQSREWKIVNNTLAHTHKILAAAVMFQHDRTKSYLGKMSWASLWTILTNDILVTGSKNQFAKYESDFSQKNWNKPYHLVSGTI